MNPVAQDIVPTILNFAAGFWSNCTLFEDTDTAFFYVGTCDTTRWTVDSMVAWRSSDVPGYSRLDSAGCSWRVAESCNARPVRLSAMTSMGLCYDEGSKQKIRIRAEIVFTTAATFELCA
jgi:hypothetical protein